MIVYAEFVFQLHLTITSYFKLIMHLDFHVTCNFGIFTATLIHAVPLLLSYVILEVHLSRHDFREYPLPDLVPLGHKLSLLLIVFKNAFLEVVQPCLHHRCMVGGKVTLSLGSTELS